MEEQFELITPNAPKVWLLVVLGMGMMLVLIAVGVFWMHSNKYDFSLMLVWIVLVVIGAMYGIPALIRIWASTPLTIVLRFDELHLHWPKTGVNRIVPFKQIISYQFWVYNGAEEFRLRLSDNGKIRIAINSDTYGSQSVASVVVAFERQLQAYRLQNDIAAIPVREKSFFEKGISTILLVVYTLLVIWGIYLLSTAEQPNAGSFIMGLGFYVAYVAAWYAAREQRRS